MSVEEVLDEIRRDKPFYDTSAGGVTLSGGEPTLNSTFALQILTMCKEEGIHTAIETCGDCPWESFTSLLPVTDLVMMDLKLIDIEAHRDATGRPNNRILDNARRLAKTDKPIVFRTPVVPSVNDSEEEIGRLASFVRELMDLRHSNGHARTDDMGIRYELLAFHGLAADKYATLGMTYDASQIHPPGTEKMKSLVNTARQCGVDVRYR
jgi:pyruvate formate lyase activating enzyme